MGFRVSKEALKTFKDKCGWFDGFNPALSVGVTLDADVSAGMSLEGGVEFGIAIPFDGEVGMCYTGYCLGGGLSLPPTPTAHGSIGAAVTIFKEPGCIPGTCEYKSLSAGLDIGIA